MILGPLRSQLQPPPPCSWASPTLTSPYLALLQGFLAWAISQAQEGSPVASIPQGLTPWASSAWKTRPLTQRLGGVSEVFTFCCLWCPTLNPWEADPAPLWLSFQGQFPRGLSLLLPAGHSERPPPPGSHTGLTASVHRDPDVHGSPRFC